MTFVYLFFTKVVMILRFGAQSCWPKTNKDIFTTSFHYNYMYVKWVGLSVYDV